MNIKFIGLVTKVSLNTGICGCKTAKKKKKSVADCFVDWYNNSRKKMVDRWFLDNL